MTDYKTFNDLEFKPHENIGLELHAPNGLPQWVWGISSHW